MLDEHLFPCDPEKNTLCSKTYCHINGGFCECTVHKEFAKELTSVHKLEEMLNTQMRFQRRLDANFPHMTSKERVAFIKEHSIHLNQEVNEMLYELPFFKPWKNYDGMTDAEIDAAFEKARMECIDAWHFFMNIMLALDLDAATFHEMYMAKNKENHRRQDAGYTAGVSYKDQSVEEVMNNG